MTRDAARARFSGGLGLEIMAGLIMRASIEPCRMQDDIGPMGCLAFGSVVMLIAGILIGSSFASD